MRWKVDLEYLIHDLKKAKEKGTGQEEHGKIMKRSHLKDDLLKKMSLFPNHLSGPPDASSQNVQMLMTKKGRNLTGKTAKDISELGS